MWNPSQLADFILAGLSDVAAAKGIGRSNPPQYPYSNLEVVSSDFEGENGVVSASITERVTNLRLVSVIQTNQQDANPYTALDNMLKRQVDEVNALARNKPADSDIVDLYVGGVTDYTTAGDKDSELQSVAAAIDIYVRHR